ncbi:hypothetical protein P691DRAFT_812152 [Macrolepiota fuliginosa MF-IS2]|uniref:SH3 domain-containing protein n=1 Tax=Macrolepiota fuliginosa MF-IS2 TaxID=1400762 RepID=A0A9P5XDV3_9AGAR|nr:hypothetical protein P691DRAFT_812152 [Macrolepiota fuliginosa MF-IS2]
MPPTRYRQHITFEPITLDSSSINDDLVSFPPLQDLATVKTVGRVDLVPAVTSFVTVTQVPTATVTATITVQRTVQVIVPSTTTFTARTTVIGPNWFHAGGSNGTGVSSSSSPITTTDSISTGIEVASAPSSTPTPSFSSSSTSASLLTTSSFSTLPPTSSSIPTSASSVSTGHDLPIPPAATPLVPPTSSSPNNQNTTLPAGGIAGVTIVIVVILLLVIIYFVRQRLQKKREKKRAWVTPFVGTKPAVRASVNERQNKRMEFLAERWERIRSRRRRNRAAQGQGSSGSGDATGGPSMGQRSRGYGSASRPPGGPLPPLPVHGTTSARRPVENSVSFFPNGAISRLDFEPDRPDELPVRAGDYLKVIALYDDGWAQCKNRTGQKGMVPTACLRINDIARRR